MWRAAETSEVLLRDLLPRKSSASTFRLAEHEKGVATNASAVIIVEGFSETLARNQTGDPTVVALMGSTEPA